MWESDLSWKQVQTQIIYYYSECASGLPQWEDIPKPHERFELTSQYSGLLNLAESLGGIWSPKVGPKKSPCRICEEMQRSVREVCFVIYSHYYISITWFYFIYRLYFYYRLSFGDFLYLNILWLLRLLRLFYWFIESWTVFVWQWYQHREWKEVLFVLHFVIINSIWNESMIN